MDWNVTDLIPLEAYREKRKNSPVEPVYYEDHVGVTGWRLFGYEEVKLAFTRHDLFSSQNPEPSEDPIESSILRTDPPKHRQLRMLVSKAFTPKIIEAMETSIRSLTEELFDRAEASGQMEVMSELASPLPISVIARMLGVPSEDFNRFKVWSEDLVGNNGERFQNCQQEMSVYFKTIADERRLHPQDDLITRLVQAQVDDEKLTELELIGFCILLLVAGNETTTNLIASSFLCLDSMPEVRAELLADRSLIPVALEEVFRYYSPVQLTYRTVKQDMELNGHQLRAGEPVFLHIGSANHDESVFEQPEVFNLHRNPNPHVGLGSGIHYCLGAQLARLEARVVLETLLERFPNFKIDHSAPLERIESNMMFGLKGLQVVLARDGTAASRYA
ncbi:cytochrome P450 [Paenibacillus herberti]|uniref:Cytochrome P450 n=1 Tax=Paenibacillus herberti TaxID=1619309 RepID=A0A229P0X2_9BACL|nr:cytochrome P450 [Paenibacillus herberti]OXM15594.1 cytochrome P450 [Paenibacillus herberti]